MGLLSIIWHKSLHNPVVGLLHYIVYGVHLLVGMSRTASNTLTRVETNEIESITNTGRAQEASRWNDMEENKNSTTTKSLE